MTDDAAGSQTPLVTVERRDDGVAVVTLANGKVNALSSALLRQLHAIAVELTEQPLEPSDQRVVIGYCMRID